MSQSSAPSNLVPRELIDKEALSVLASCAANLEEKLGGPFLVNELKKNGANFEFSGSGAGMARGFAVVRVRVLAPAGKAPRVDSIIAFAQTPGDDGEMVVCPNIMMGANCQPGSGCKFDGSLPPLRSLLTGVPTLQII